jgi:hypothetical protein
VVMYVGRCQSQVVTVFCAPVVHHGIPDMLA